MSPPTKPSGGAGQRRRCPLPSIQQSERACHRSGVEVAHLGLAGLDVVVISAPMADDRAMGDLTPAEREVCEQLVHGSSNEQIAQTRGSSVRTVANQVAAIFGKLGVSSRAELVIACLGPAGRRNTDSG